MMGYAQFWALTNKGDWRTVHWDDGAVPGEGYKRVNSGVVEEASLSFVMVGGEYILYREIVAVY